MGDAFGQRHREYFRKGIEIVSFALIANVIASMLNTVQRAAIPSWVLLNLAITALSIIGALLLVVRPT